MPRPRLPDTPARQAARERQARYRQRKDAAQVAQIEAGADDDPSDPSSSQLTPAGLLPYAVTSSTYTPGQLAVPANDADQVGDLMDEQAKWVAVRRRISELELQRRRGELILIEDATRDAQALARRIRAALDRAAAHLPGDLAPEIRDQCAKALGVAVSQAMALL